MGTLEEALAVWRAARTAEGRSPDPERVERVAQKLADADAHLVSNRRAGLIVGMALAEPFRDEHGAGSVLPGWGHVTMVFVHPEHQGCGVGRELMHQLVADVPWPWLSVWTRVANARAVRLYESVGFAPTGERGRTPHGDPIRRWERRPLGSV